MELQGVVLKTDGPNINGIYYTKKCLEKIAESLKGKELIGENNPPKLGVGIDRNSTVLLSNAACVTKNIRYENGNIIGDVTVTNKEIISKIENAMPYSFGLRSIGEFEIDGDGDKYVEPEGFQVITFDLVTDPEYVWVKD